MPRALRSALAVAAACLAAAGVPATASAVTVTSHADSGDGTLRDAIANASAGETIVVPSGAQHYAVTSGELQIAQDLTIVGGGARHTVIDVTGGASRVFAVTGGTVTIRGVTIMGGSADFGGGVRNVGTLTLKNDTITSNHAASGYGGVENLGDLTIDSSAIVRNVSDGQGGGIGNISSGTVDVENSTVAANRAGPPGGTLGGAGTAGGGVSLGGAMTTIENSTIARNVAAGQGGGIYDGGNSGTNQRLHATIVAGNVSGDQGQNCGFLHPDNFHSDGFNLADDGSCALDQTSDQVADPQLGRLRNNGGPTDTLALGTDSAAIDRGDPSVCPAFDQRHVQRPLDGDGDGEAACDVGAFEARPAKPHCSLDAVGPRVFGHTFTDANGKRHQKGVIRLRAQCDQAVQLRLTGTVVARRNGHPKRTFDFTAVTAPAAKLATVRLHPKLPAAALRLLRHGAHESAAFVLTGKNANGTARATAAIDRLVFTP